MVFCGGQLPGEDIVLIFSLNVRQNVMYIWAPGANEKEIAPCRLMRDIDKNGDIHVQITAVQCNIAPSSVSFNQLVTSNWNISN